MRGADLDPWSLISSRVATQLQNAGVTIQADTRYGIGNLGVAGGGYAQRGPIGSFEPGTNRVVYNPTAGGVSGILQHELVHAAASNIHPLKLGSVDPRLAIQYGVGQAARGNKAAGLSMFAASKIVPNTFNRFFAPFTGGWSFVTEGLADRSGAYTYPTWGEGVRSKIVPAPVDNPYITRPARW